LNVHGLAQLFGHPTDVVRVDGSSVVVVKQVENFVNSVLHNSNMYSALFVTKLRGNTVEELFEVNLSTERFELCNHVENSWVFAFKAETLHGWFKLTRIDFACGLSVEEIEGLSQFFDLVFSESWSFYFLFDWSALSWYSFSHGSILIKFKLNIELIRNYPFNIIQYSKRKV